MREDKVGDQDIPVLIMLSIRNFCDGRVLIDASRASWLADRTLGTDTPLRQIGEVRRIR